MSFEFPRCRCGAALVEDFISVRPGGNKPAVRVAVATICPSCKGSQRVRGVRMEADYKGKLQLFQVESLYRATRLNIFSEEEMRTGKVPGFNVPEGYNPDAFHETKKGREE